MGCLFELIFEIVFEVIVEAVIGIYMKLMTLFVPKHQFDQNLRNKIKNIVTVFAVFLFLTAFLGWILFMQPPSLTKTIGAYMLFIPLGLMGIQIVAGVILRIVRAIRKKH